MVETILKVESLHKIFGSITAVDNLSFEVKKGEVVGILGPNGSGKTTTLAVVLSVQKPTSGSYSWFGGFSGSAANKRIGSLLEVPYFYPYLNLEDNLRITALARGYGEQDIQQVLQEVNLHQRVKSKYFTLSLGMKQRLAIASALLGNPEVLILDEPTNGLDPEGIAEVRELIIQQAANGKTIIMASHILDEVEKVCSHVIILKKGKCLASGKVNELLHQNQQLIVEADNIELLNVVLTQNTSCKVVSKETNQITISLEPDYSASQLNKWLIEQGIIVSRFEPKRSSLESQFMEIVKGDQSK